MKAKIIKSISNAQSYLLLFWSNKKCWSDFYLTPGESDIWVAAYVGLCLSPIATKNPELYDILKDVAKYLQKHVNKDYGWSYNSLTRSDTDTTSHVIRFFNEIGAIIDGKSYQMLNKLQQPDGGFATFHSRGIGDSWATSHPDVTPSVLLALNCAKDVYKAELSRGIYYTLKSQRANGTWKSFWWGSDTYCTKINLECLNVCDKLDIAQLPSQKNFNLVALDNAFDISQFIEISLLSGWSIETISMLTNKLISMQRENGSWTPSAHLKEIDPNNKSTDCIVSIDQNAVFTTASCISALSRAVKFI